LGRRPIRHSKYASTAFAQQMLSSSSWARVTALYVVRQLERLTLGTSYPDVARRVREVVLGVLNRGASTVSLFVDTTGVGQPVVDLLVAAIGRNDSPRQKSSGGWSQAGP
jgi:hypothetical protein